MCLIQISDGWRPIPGLGGMRVGEHYFYLTLVLVGVFVCCVLRRISNRRSDEY